MPEPNLGTVSKLWRYPVKSMLGEPCERLELDARGVRGDRQLAIRELRKVDSLFAFRAVQGEDGPCIVFPDGKRLVASHPEWIGRTLAIGRSVRLRIIEATERCVMTTYAQADLPADARVLTRIGRQAQLRFGVYAEVLDPGTVARGDPVR